MRVLVTGANGFVGRAVVAEAALHGCEIVALVRPGRVFDPGEFEGRVDVVVGDLRSPGEWIGEVGPIDAVIHVAAAAGGDRAEQLANTVVATERFLAALESLSVARFVHVSSFSVYDYHEVPTHQSIDERSPLERTADPRDAYTEAKLVQDELVRAWCAQQGVDGVVVRPGAVVGPGKTWGGGAALTVGSLAIVAAPRVLFPYISLSDCAGGIVGALAADTTGIHVINLVADDLPTYAQYFRCCRKAGELDLLMVPVPWRVLDLGGRALQAISRRWLGGRLRLPEILDHRRQEARWKPFRYPATGARRLLGSPSHEPLEVTLRHAFGSARVVADG